MGNQRTLDFIVDVTALLVSIAKMKNRKKASDCPVLVLGADSGKIHVFPGPFTVTISVKKVLVHGDGL